MKRLLTTLFVISFFTNALYAQSFNWIKGGGSTHTLASGTRKEAVYSMCTDYNGNVYVLSAIGNLGPIIADTFSRPGGAYGSDENVLFASYTCSGQMRFAKLISGNGGKTYGLVCDTTGHVYFAMYSSHGSSYSSMLRIGGDTTITGSAYQTQMLVQYDTSGNLDWVRFVGDNTTATMVGALSYGSDLAMDGNNNVHFINTMKYGVPITPTLTSHWGTYDLKYDATGNLLSVKQLQYDSSLIKLGGVCIDKNSGKLYAYGMRQTGMFPDSSDYPYLIAFDTARNIIWKDTLANHCFSGPGYAAFGAITTDNIGNLYLTGAGAGCASYRTDTVVNALSGQVGFILKTDTAGNVQWMKGISASTSINGYTGITLTPNGNVAVAGGMAGTIISTPYTLASYSGEGQNSSFIVLDTAGYIDTFQQLHGAGFYDRANCIVSDRIGRLYIGGQAETNTWGGSLTPYTSIGGNSDFYVIKYGVDCGCTSMPVAAYTHTAVAGVYSFTYTGTTTPSIDSVRWDFGDGGTSTLLNPTHNYATGDTFTACVRVYTPCGSDLYCQTFIIPCVSAPVSSFTMSGTGLIRTFTYTGTTTGVSSISWSFTGGTGATSGTPISHTFPAAGTYTVCVTAINPCGTTTTCSPVTVSCTSTPVSSFSVSGTGLSKSFTYTGTTAGLDSVTWTFGDGGTATGLTPGHTYAAAGVYTVCAKVYTNCGVHTYCNPITVTCSSTPIASFTFSGTGATRTFTYTGTVSGMDSVRWYFGDGGTSTILNPSHTFSTEDTFHVCVTIYTNCGSHTSCQDIIVTCFLPITAAFIDTGVLVHGFVYTGTTAWYDSVVWDFGDGNTDTGLFVVHTYAIADTYHVCAKVYTNCGTHTWCKDVYINVPGSVQAVSSADIKVYPNPATNELYVTGVPERMGYRLLNVVGVIADKGTFNPGMNIIQAQQLPPGMYLLEMTGNNGLKNVVRIIKQ